MAIEIPLHALRPFGAGLSRPEGVVADRQGTVWAADGRGYCHRLASDGSATAFGQLEGTPNGICLDTRGGLIVANIGSGQVQQLAPDGTHQVLGGGAPKFELTTPNFPAIDRQGRLWVSNSTARRDYKGSLREPAADGSLCCFADGQWRSLADGLWFANGLALDAAEQFIYLAETLARRIVRYKVFEDGALGPVEQYGPELGDDGHPDGIAFDVEGNLWVTLPTRNALGVLDSRGNWTIAVEDHGGKLLRRPTNICFGDPDLRTAYVGSLRAEWLVQFTSPIPGLPLVHQAM